MSTVISVLAALIVLSIFVVLHELGHYCAGRIFGFGIVEFSVGMGPAIIKKEKNGITYALRALPIGGMCQFYGEDQADTGDGKAFSCHPIWQRMIVIAAGPVMNILTTIILATVMLMTYGEYMPAVNSFSFENSPAEVAGMQSGDIIVAVDGHELSYYNEVSSLIRAADSKSMTLEVIRGGEHIEIEIKDFYSEQEDRNIIGIVMEPARLKQNFFGAVAGSFTCSSEETQTILPISTPRRLRRLRTNLARLQFSVRLSRRNPMRETSVLSAAPIEEIKGMPLRYSVSIRQHFGFNASIASTT